MSYGICKKCGCTEENACTHPDAGSCSWVGPEHDLCSHCSDEQISNDSQTKRPTFNLDDPNRAVQCGICDDVHKWSDRIEKKVGIWTVYLCPECGAESYINISIFQ